MDDGGLGPAKPVAILLHIVDDAEAILWGGAFAESSVPRALLRSSPAAGTWLAAHQRNASTQLAIGDSGAVLHNVHTSSPICQPSRWSLLSGRYASAGTINRSSSVFFQQRPLAAGETVAGVLQRHGWHSGFFGKFHASALYKGAPYSALQALVRAAGFGVAEALYGDNVAAGRFHAPECAMAATIPSVIGCSPTWKRLPPYAVEAAFAGGSCGTRHASCERV